jgi:hypothetical protein
MIKTGCKNGCPQITQIYAEKSKERSMPVGFH